MRITATLALIFALMVGPAIAGPKTLLHDIREIDDAMLWVALALEFREKCEVIDARTLKGHWVPYALKRRAQKLGYSDADISAYVKSPDEKARMRKRGEAYVRARGLDPAQPAALCALGRAEIERSSKIGVLLSSK